MLDNPTAEGQRLEILQLFPFFQDLSDSFQQQMIKTAELASLPRGAFYFEEGHSCSRIALVGGGDIRVFKRGETGREITLYHVERGQTCILTASCVLAHTPYPATAIVDTDALAVLFPADIFRDWVARNEIIRRFVFSSLANRMEGVLSLIEEITFGKLDERLLKFLEERSLAFPGKQGIQMTHEEIATELGSVREVISRILKDFERRGLLQQSRGKILLK
ncbi:MAG: Crp/Fnr family transcriptional regulator [Candidatus Marinimicrobia bacterium]|jgi:CRP/FNR family transcriptional regulator|nr:Crp/Fnr family transcriptional regulator [Candidatus Neomarinimicrobiota bacterium]MBT7579895.1 Crp/Fnr family transcriptional regulator [Candidatus Neomarinimicrobiota bacterium]MBT7831282.1 Crp/Fnr family transcriptional regulator [Candidatus Neomarinimicrobiota bacterium]